MTRRPCLSIPILTGLSGELRQRWQSFFVLPSDRDRMREEGIWRRTQSSLNAAESGWSGPNDARRRILHYVHRFNTIQSGAEMHLAITGSYIFFSISLPEDELIQELDSLTAALRDGGWHNDGVVSTGNIWRIPGMKCSLIRHTEHPEDIRAGRKLPLGYMSVDVTLRMLEDEPVDVALPWKVLSTGMRAKDRRQTPMEVQDLSILLESQPFHVEIGCGVSIEAGVPALNHLHELYCVADITTGKFIFGGQSDDLIEQIIRDPFARLSLLGTLFKASFEADPTQAHRSLKALRRSGAMTGSVLTNNFDGLAHRAGLPECFLRRYDQHVPSVDFDSRAQALLVIGSHADRRRVQSRARARGLKVVFLDLEGYEVSGRFIPYPLEGPKDDDFLCRRSASDGLTELCAQLGLTL